MGTFSIRRERPPPQSVEVVCCGSNHGTPQHIGCVTLRYALPRLSYPSKVISFIYVTLSHVSLAILSYTSLAFNIPHDISFTPLVQLMGGGNNHLGTTYCHRISIPCVVAIGVSHHHFLKFILINSEASPTPSIRSYWALSVVISVCHISLIDSAGGCLFAENTLVHLVVHMHHMVMGASIVHRSPSFCFCAITVVPCCQWSTKQFHSPLCT